MTPKNQKENTTPEETNNIGLGSKLSNVKDSVVGKVGDIKDSLTGNKDTRDPDEIKFDKAKQAFQDQTADLEDTKNRVVGEADVVKDAVAEKTESMRETLVDKLGTAQEKAEDAAGKNEDESPGLAGKISNAKEAVASKVGDIKDSWTGPKDTRDPTEVKLEESKEAFKNQTANFEDTKNLVVGEAANLKNHLTLMAEKAEDKADDAKKEAADDTAEALETAKSVLEKEE